VKNQKSECQWVEKIIDSEGLERIHQAVVRAEEKTCAEIVPMIVRSSAASGHVPWILFLLILLIAWTSLPWLIERSPWDISDWIWDVAAFAVTAALTYALSSLDFFKRLLTPSHDRAIAVDRRAMHEFHHSRISATEHSTGILIFVSLLERRAIVLADRAVAEKFPETTWGPVVQALLSKTKAGDFTGGMCAAIEHVGEKLKTVLPARADDKNEVDDLLIVKD
jgi:putative membrane protein